MNAVLRCAVVLAAVAQALPASIAGQGFGGEFRAAVGFPTVNRENLATVDRLSGTVFGLEAGVRWWRVELTARYLQGPVESSVDQSQSDLVQGAVSLEVWPVEFLVLGLGPQARSYVSDAGTERWLTWEGRLGIETWLLRPILRSSLALSYALGGDVNTGSEFSQGRSVEGWLEARIPRAPVSVAVGYRVEYGTLSGNAGTDTLEEFLLGVAVGRWR